MTDLSRRGALGLFSAALFAPAIIRTPGMLMLPPLKRVHVTRICMARNAASPLVFSAVKLVDGKYVQAALGALDRLGQHDRLQSSTEVTFMRTLPTGWYLGPGRA